jgi:hypothetical protein
MPKIKYHDRNFEVCPFCDYPEFFRGPEGAGSVNIKCAMCGATFNDMGRLGVQVLSWPEKKPMEIGALLG